MTDLADVEVLLPEEVIKALRMSMTFDDSNEVILRANASAHGCEYSDGQLWRDGKPLDDFQIFNDIMRDAFKQTGDSQRALPGM